MLIDDGAGSGTRASVTDSNRLNTSARIGSRLYYCSRYDGNAYTWTAVSADIDTGDTGLYVVNNSTTKKLYIERVYVWGDVAAQFKIHCPAYATPAGGSVVVGMNMNRTSGRAADATCRADETANTFAAANVITTVRNTYMSRGNGDDNADIPAAGFGQWVDYQSALILGYHDAIAVDIIGETAAFECTIIGHFHNEPD